MKLFKIPLNLTYDKVLPFLGITGEASPREQELILHYLKVVQQKAHPVGTWKVFAVERHEPGKIILKNSTLILEGQSTTAHFQTCEKVTLLATTLSSELDLYLTRLSEENPAYALIFDGVASAAVEYLTEQLDQYLSGEIRHKGYFPTARFSPGYGDWPLHWQKNFLESLDAAKIGLTTTPHYLLQPIKSVTAALGWSNIPIERSYSSPAPAPAKKPCRSMNTCPYCTLASTCPEHLPTSEL